MVRVNDVATPNEIPAARIGGGGLKGQFRKSFRGDRKKAGSARRYGLFSSTSDGVKRREVETTRWMAQTPSEPGCARSISRSTYFPSLVFLSGTWPSRLPLASSACSPGEFAPARPITAVFFPPAGFEPRDHRSNRRRNSF